MCIFVYLCLCVCVSVSVIMFCVLSLLVAFADCAEMFGVHFKIGLYL